MHKRFTLYILFSSLFSPIHTRIYVRMHVYMHVCIVNVHYVGVDNACVCYGCVCARMHANFIFKIF